MPLQAAELSPNNLIQDTQQVFRCCLTALSRPWTPVAVPAFVPGEGALYPSTMSVLIALADFETRIWLDDRARADASVVDSLVFRTGAVITDQPAKATFAVVSRGAELPPLDQFGQGTADYPDQSTTVLIQVAALRSSGPAFRGPGIQTTIEGSAEPLPANFETQLHANRARFPLGVDLLLLTPEQVVGLPRSTRLITGEGG